MTRTAGALIGRRRSSAFWGLGCPKTHHEIKDSLVGDGQRRRYRVIEARDMENLLSEIALSKEKLKLPPEVLVVSCFEAGRDGHWLHRALCAQGIDNLEVTSTSIKVRQQGKHRKTDRLDLDSLYIQLIHYMQGEREELQVVNVPSEAAEAEMRLDRMLSQLKKEQTQHRNRMQSVLIRYGLRLKQVGGPDWDEKVSQLQDWSGKGLPIQVQSELHLENRRLALVEQQRQELERERDGLIEEGEGKVYEQIRRLMSLRSLGPVISWRLVMEFYGWRAFKNRKQIGALSGLVGTPYNSGQSEREQGISHEGNPRVRSLAIELAWLWVRLQPHSKWSMWFNRRFAQGGKRMRKIGIVGVARHLLIDLWHFLEEGVVPEGAVLKRI
ncbi:MAG: IS110 family transposase [Candidatus Thiodiazotropha sp. L084R]